MTAAELQDFGLLPEDFEGDVVEVWPDNWLVCTIFQWMGSQWNVGPGGLVGLRYEVFPEARLRFAIEPGDWPDICDGLQVMEEATLKKIRLDTMHG